MQRLLRSVLVGVVVLAFGHPLYSMQKIGTPGGAIPPGLQLGRKQPAPPLSAAQLATIKQRVVTAMSGLDKIHVVGSKIAPIPPEALDAIAEWRSQSANDVELWWDPDTRTPYFIKGNDLALPTTASLGKLGHGLHTAAAVATFKRLPEFLGLRAAESELREISRETDQLGLTHVRFQQTYRGHDVWARDLYCHFTPDSRMNLINGRWAPTPIQLDGIDPLVTSSAAVDAVKSRFADHTQVETSNLSLVVYIDTDQVPHWAWMVRASLGSTEGYDVFIDAVTGHFLHQVSFVCSNGPVVGSGADVFGTTRTVNAYQVGATYYMINTTKPMYNAAGSTFPDNVKGGIVLGNQFRTTNPPLYVMSSQLTVWDSAAVSAGRNLGIVYDYFKAVHSRNSIDGQGTTLLAVVNDPKPEASGNNATFNNNLQCMFFGTGDGVTFRNLAGALDVTAHEMSHGVIYNTAKLTYEFESGALNESFADVFGEQTEYFSEGPAADWLIGEDVYTPAIPGDALRSMQDPPSGGDPQPWRYSNRAVLPATNDHGGVHTNSGIPNKAFYLIATSIGRNRADSIFYRTLVTKLTSSSQFIDLRRGVLQSASELFPGNAGITGAITSAFDAVEIYDGPPTPPPNQEQVPTSAQWIAAIDNSTGRVARYDTSGSFQLLISSARAISKPSVPDSAQVIFFIDSTNSIRLVGANGAGETQLPNSGTVFQHIAISPNGNKLAFDVFPYPTIFILDLTDGSGASDRVWPLYTPTYQDSVVAHDVLYPDVLEWDISGKNIFYDCFNRLPRQSDTLWYWDILSLDVQTGIVLRTIPSIPAGVTVGNPTVAKTKPNVIAFDAELVAGAITVVGADLERNKLDIITPNGTSWGRPSFSPNDRRLVYHFAGDLWRVSLDSTSIHGLGDDQKLVTSADAPNWRFTGRDTPVDVSEDEGGPAIPTAFELHQNYPNPFNASTVISYDVRSVGPVSLEIFNILGQRVFVRNEEALAPGRRTFTWDGVDHSGATVPSGLYLYRVSAKGVQQTRKMVLLK